MPQPAEEFFYLDREYQRQDAGLHEPILADGDHAAAAASSVAVLKRLGWSDERIETFLNGASK